MQISLIVEWSSLSCLNTRQINLNIPYEQSQYMIKSTSTKDVKIKCGSRTYHVLTLFWKSLLHSFLFFLNFETFVTLAILPTRDYSGAIF